jgi:hypothetical protein
VLQLQLMVVLLLQQQLQNSGLQARPAPHHTKPACNDSAKGGQQAQEGQHMQDTATATACLRLSAHTCQGGHRSHSLKQGALHHSAAGTAAAP